MVDVLPPSEEELAELPPSLEGRYRQWIAILLRQGQKEAMARLRACFERDVMLEKEKQQERALEQSPFATYRTSDPPIFVDAVSETAEYTLPTEEELNNLTLPSLREKYRRWIAAIRDDEHKAENIKKLRMYFDGDVKRTNPRPRVRPAVQPV